MSELIEKSRVVATAAHMAANHYRKISNEPYIVHPADVAATTKRFLLIIYNDISVPYNHPYNMVTENMQDMIAAAWLHDTVEDTGLTLEFIKAEFGDDVHDLVDALTDEKAEDLDRNERLAAYIAKLNAPKTLDAQVVKLADIDSNFRDIVRSHDNPDPNMKFKKYKRFVDEKTKVIDSMILMKTTPIAIDLKNRMAEFIRQMETLDRKD